MIDQPITQTASFWAWNIGQVISLVAILLSFWGAHFANVARIERSASRLQGLETKMDLIYQWFTHNVVGRGEPPRGKNLPGAGARVIPSEIEDKEGGLGA